MPNLPATPVYSQNNDWNTFCDAFVNCNLYMEELLTILKNLRDKRVTIMNNNSEIYGAFQHKTIFHRFCLSTDDPFLTGERVRPLNGFQILGLEPVNDHF